jgi:hypothetical protein
MAQCVDPPSGQVARPPFTCEFKPVNGGSQAATLFVLILTDDVAGTLADRPLDSFGRDER